MVDGAADSKLKSRHLLEYTAHMAVRRVVQRQRVTEGKTIAAKQMRRSPTEAEEKLWQQLRGGRLGVKFRRQQVIDGFIADFYCHSASLVVEVDGSVHDASDQKAYDLERDQIFADKGLRILRFRNEEVMESVGMVLAMLRAAVK
jgi:very-short-patch-repair endonuclease